MLGRLGAILAVLVAGGWAGAATTVAVLPVQGGWEETGSAKHRPVVEQIIQEAVQSVEAMRLADPAALASLLDALELTDYRKPELIAAYRLGASLMIRPRVVPEEAGTRARLEIIDTVTGQTIADRMLQLADPAAAGRELSASLQAARPSSAPENRVDVVLLPLRRSNMRSITLSELLPVIGLEQYLSERLDEIEQIRLVDASLGQFVNDQPRFQPDVFAGAPSPDLIDGLILVRVDVSYPLLPEDNAVFADAPYGLSGAVSHGDRTERFEIAGTVAEGPAIEAGAADRIRRAIAGIANLSAIPPVTPTPIDENRNRARRLLVDAVTQARSVGRGDDTHSMSILDALEAAFALMPDSHEPPAAAYEVLIHESGIFGDEAMARLSRLRRSLIDQHAHAPWWGTLIARDLHSRSSTALSREQHDEDRRLANQLAVAVLEGRTPMTRQLSIYPIRLLLNDEAYQFAMNYCLMGTEGRDRRGWIELAEYAAAAVERDRPIYALKAAEAMSRYYPGYELQWLEQSRRHAAGDETVSMSRQLTEGGLAKWWKPILNRHNRQLAARQRRDQLNVTPGNMPPMVDPWVIEGTWDIQIPAGYHLEAQVRGAANLVLLRKSDALFIWDTDEAEPLQLQPGGVGNQPDPLTRRLTAEPFIPPPMRLAQVGERVYAAAGDGGLLAIDPETGDSEVVVITGIDQPYIADVHVRDDKLFVAGGASGEGLLARLDDADKGEWTILRGPASLGVVVQFAPAPDGWRMLHRRTGQVSTVTGDQTRWSEGRPAYRYAFEPRFIAFGGGRTLMIEVDRNTTDPMWLLNETDGGMTAIHFPPVTLSQLSTDLSRHKWFWKDTLPEAVAPLAGNPVDIAADGEGRIWILDQNGCVTALGKDGRFAGPFKVANSGRMLAVAEDGSELRVVGDQQIVGISRERLAEELEQEAVWTDSSVLAADVKGRLATWIDSKPAIERSWYYGRVEQSGLAAEAMLSANLASTVEGAAVMAERLIAGDMLDAAEQALSPWLNDWSNFDWPALETAYLKLLAAKEDWPKVIETVDQLWQNSLLRGNDVPADDRFYRWSWAIKQTRTPAEHEAALWSLAMGELPPAPWDWNDGPVYRDMARDLRRKAAGALARSLGERRAYAQVIDHPLLGTAAWSEGTHGAVWALYASAGRYEQAARLVEKAQDRLSLALMRGDWSEALPDPADLEETTDSSGLRRYARAAMYDGNWEMYDRCVRRCESIVQSEDHRAMQVRLMRGDDAPDDEWPATSAWARAEGLEYSGRDHEARQAYAGVVDGFEQTLAGAEAALRLGELSWLGDGDREAAVAWFDRADAMFSTLGDGDGPDELRAYALWRRGMINLVFRDDPAAARTCWEAAASLEGPAVRLAGAAVAALNAIAADGPLIMAVGTDRNPESKPVVDIRLDAVDWITRNLLDPAIQPDAAAHSPLGGAFELFEWGNRHDRWYIYLWYPQSRIAPGIGWVRMRLGGREELVWCRLRNPRDHGSGAD